MRFAPGREREHHVQYDVPAPLGRVEDAGAITETGVLVLYGASLTGGEIQHDDVADHVADLLTVRAHVLNRRAAYRAGNAAQALDSRAVGVHRARNERVPIFTGADDKEHVLRAGAHEDLLDRYLQYQSRPSGIRYDQVAAAAEHEQPQLLLACVSDGLPHFVVAASFDKISCRSAHLKRRQRRERHVFLDVH